MVAFALNETELLDRIAQCEVELSKSKGRIELISASFCVRAGACALKAKESIAVNRMNMRHLSLLLNLIFNRFNLKLELFIL